MDEFEQIVQGLDINSTQIEKKARAAQMASMLKLMAEAIEADAEAGDKSEHERDCLILPEHFTRMGEKVIFSAPAEERNKLGNMMPGLTLAVSMATMLASRIEDAMEEWDEITDKLGIEGTIDIAGLQVITETLHSAELSLEQTRVWEKLFYTLQNGVEVGSEDYDQLFALTEKLRSLRS